MKKKKPVLILVLIVLLAVLAGVFDYQPVWSPLRSQIHLPEGFNRDWRLGLDLVGGSILTYDIDLSRVESVDRASAVNGDRDIIEKRVNSWGVAEPQIYTAEVGENRRLIVELAGIKDIKEAIKMIGETPLLDFREVVEAQTDADKTQTSADSPAESVSLEFIPTILTGRYVKSAQVNIDNLGGPVVDITFKDEGAKIFEELTGRNIGKPLAIFLDNELIEIAVVKEKISGGQAQISGNFTPESARQFVKRFNEGALWAPINLVSQQTVGASLGLNSLEKALFAGLIGFLLVIIFMLIYYRTLGLIASLALIIYVAFTLAIFKLVPVTLTLAGIAGFILSLGMAVDANVLIFSRIKEELKKGLPKPAAVEEGFRRAWLSIRDSNITTIIIALILFYLATSFVKGFALTLLIGVLMSMFSAIFVTRAFLRVFVKSQNMKHKT